MKKKSILLVDDEAIILATIGRDLSFENFDIDIASSAEEALKKTNNNSYDLIISDFMMPGMNGLQLLKAVKEKDPLVVFFILTGYGDSISTLEILEAGADEMLLKPCDTDELLIRIDKDLKRQEIFIKLKEYEEKLPICCVCGEEMCLESVA